MSKITTIIGYTASRSEMPSLDVNNGMDRVFWIEANMVSTHRSGHWNAASCQAIAARMGIVDGLSIKFH